MKNYIIRTNFSLPENLIKELRKFVPKRKYSQFVKEAIDEKLKRERKKHLLSAAGTIDLKDYPEWKEPVEYVRELRGYSRYRRIK